MCTSRLFLEKPKHFQGKALCLKWGVADTKESLPPLVFPPESFLKEIGNSMVTRMVLHHHTLLQDSAIAHMYPKDKEKFLEGVTKAADTLYEKLTAAGIEVLYDDRDERAGVKFADADLLGMPQRVTVSAKTLERDSFELKARTAPEASLHPLTDAVKMLGGAPA